MSGLRRAAEAAAKRQNDGTRSYEPEQVQKDEWSIMRWAMDALSSPDELAEARRLIAILENSGVNRDVRSDARDFLKRTDGR